MNIRLPTPSKTRPLTARERRLQRQHSRDVQQHERDKARLQRKKATRTALQVSPWIGLAVLISLWPRPGLGPYGDVEENRHARTEPGRGRDANSPREIPARGWTDALWRTFKEFNDDQVTRVAGGVTFFGLLALFPGMACFVALYGLFADVHDVQKQLAVMAGFMPRDVLLFVGEQMIRIAGQQKTGLSFAFITALLLSLWSANAGMKALFQGLNIAYDEREKRKFIRLNLISLLFTLGAVIFMLVAMSAVAIVPLIFSFTRLDPGLFSVLRWPALLVAMMCGLAVLYRFGPSRRQPRWAWVTPGSIVASLLWLGGSLLFSWYLSNFAHYDRTYGSLGAAVGVMTWLWLSSIIVLLGAELNGEVEHQTAVDSTTGPPKPLGARGAIMADTVGKARSAKKTSKAPERP
jgi:membrane protein